MKPVLFALLMIFAALTATGQNISIPTPLGSIYTGSRPTDILANAAQYGINMGYNALIKKGQKNKSLKVRVKESNQACTYQLDRLEKNDNTVKDMLRLEYSRILDKFTADGRNKRNPFIVDTHVNDLNRPGRLATYFNTTCQSIQSLQSLFPTYRYPLETEYKSFVATLVVTQPDFSSDEAVTILGGKLGDIQRGMMNVLPSAPTKQPTTEKPSTIHLRM